MKTKNTNRKEHTMKNTKRKIFVAALALSLVAIISMGSLAWFSDSDSVANNFMVASSTDDPDDIFSVDVYEYTEPGSTTKEQNGKTYTDVLPGDQLTKEAHVANTGYYDQYIRVTVTISDATAWANMLTPSGAFNDATLAAVFEGFDASMWDMVNSTSTYDATADTITVVLYYKGILYGTAAVAQNAALTSDITVFDAVNIPTGMTQQDAIDMDEEFSINVVADAIQTENVGVTNTTPAGQEAFTAFSYVATH